MFINKRINLDYCFFCFISGLIFCFFLGKSNEVEWERGKEEKGKKELKYRGLVYVI